MPTDKAQPIPLAPNTRAHRDLGVQLDAHLEIALKLWHRDGVGMTHLRTPLEAAIDHSVKVSLLGRLGRGSLHRGTVDGLVEDRIVGIVFFHCAQVIRALEEMLTLARGVLCAHGLAVDALRGETLRNFGRISMLYNGIISDQKRRWCYVTGRKIDGSGEEACRWQDGRVGQFTLSDSFARNST